MKRVHYETHPCVHILRSTLIYKGRTWCYKYFYALVNPIFGFSELAVWIQCIDSYQYFENKQNQKLLFFFFKLYRFSLICILFVSQSMDKHKHAQKERVWGVLQVNTQLSLLAVQTGSSLDCSGIVNSATVIPC